ncbi:hypothetical protein ABPG72_013558 [Tetrahymena utriculariae]
MEFDIINELISDTLGRFFSTDNQVIVIDDFRGMFTSQVKKSTISTQLTSLNSQNQQNTSSQNIKNIEISPFISKQPQVISQNQPISNQSQNQVRSYNSSLNLSQQGQSSSTSQTINQSNSLHNQQTQWCNVQRNNLIEQSNEELTPEIWIKKEGPNKLVQAQQRLNLNLSRVSRSDLENMSLEQLTHEKKKVKQELKMYDASFQTHFNRFPQKNEKEPLRPLYIYYKKLKQFMLQKGQIGSVNDDNEDEPVRTRTVQQQKQQQQYQQQRSQNSVSIQNQNIANPQKAQIIQQIEELKKVRADLRDKLHDYQQQFFNNNNRRIRYHKDIQPVEKEYKAYKETKEELLKLEKILNNQQ